MSLDQRGVSDAGSSQVQRESFPDGLVVQLEPPTTEREDANAAQPFDIFQGTMLIGCTTDPHIVNGPLLTVARSTAETVWLRDDETHKTCKLTHASVMRHARLRHTITIAASQSRTLEGVVCVWDIHSLYFYTTHLYVACSRCRGAEYMQVMGGDGVATKKRLRCTKSSAHERHHATAAGPVLRDQINEQQVRRVRTG